MRVGISGTHGTGKTTLAEALCAHLPGHVAADEPYYLLEEEGYEFGFPPSLEDYRALLACCPDVILMDVRMPVLDGLQATRQIMADGNGVPRVLVLTTFDLDDYVHEALRAGASGFLLKDASAGELAEAVRVAASGDALLAPGVTRRLIAEFARLGAPRAASRKNVEDLTERETEVLALVARGMSNAEIAGHLVVAEQTVKTHVSRILMKLGLRDRAQAVVFAYESGLVRPGE
jgi:DNA-binding NarL/FixJ family response regulator